MRNKSECKDAALGRLPSVPPSYEWRIVNGQEQVWHRGCVTFWVNRSCTLEETVAKAWRRWEQQSGISRERYMDLLDYESRCHDGEECQVCADREESEISLALEKALW